MREHSSAWGARSENLDDEGRGLKNHCSLLVIGIRHLYHEIYGFEEIKLTKKKNRLECSKVKRLGWASARNLDGRRERRKGNQECV